MPLISEHPDVSVPTDAALGRSVPPRFSSYPRFVRPLASSHPGHATSAPLPFAPSPGAAARLVVHHLLPSTSPHQTFRPQTFLVTAAILAAVALAVTGYGVWGPRSEGVRALTDEVPAADMAGRFVATSDLDIAAVLTKVQPSVVAFHSGRADAANVYGESAGSGIVISADGLVLTNAHVLEGATHITARLHDGVTYDADLVSSSPTQDLAVVQLRGAEHLVAADLGDSSMLRVGDDVLAIGNALGLAGAPSVTKGIISGEQRSVRASGLVLADLIQTDAAINPGNSGGPLVNSSGSVVGINTAIVGGAQSIGFAIPINTVQDILSTLVRGGGELRGEGFLGVESSSVTDLDPQIREASGVTATTGAVVHSVLAGTAADHAGIVPGDIIIGINAETIDTIEDLDLVATLEPGITVVIHLIRGTERVDSEVLLGSRARDNQQD